MAMILALLVAGCSAGGSPSSSVGGPAGLIGSWVLVEGTGPGGDAVIVDGFRITLEIEGAEVGGTSACNHYFGRLAAVGDALRVDELGGTEMACEPAVMASESAYLAALSAVTRWARDGDTLVLSGPSASLSYTLLQPVPDAAMVDSVWVLDTLIWGEAASSVEARATLELGSNGTLVGSTGCRDLTGRYVINGDQVVVTDLAAHGDCPAELTGQDDHVISVLEGEFTVQVEGNHLTLGASGNLGLSYTAEAE
jgi:heat shock protein HslJ